MRPYTTSIKSSFKSSIYPALLNVYFVHAGVRAGARVYVREHTLDSYHGSTGSLNDKDGETEIDLVVAHSSAVLLLDVFRVWAFQQKQKKILQHWRCCRAHACPSQERTSQDNASREGAKK